jgi:uncharacterized protein (TIGR00369 family)
MKLYSKSGVGSFFSVQFDQEINGLFYFSIKLPAQSLNPSGIVQGGMISSVLDDCTSLSVIMRCEGKRFPTTTDFHTTFHRPLKLEPVKVTTSILKLGKNLVSVEGKMFKKNDTLVACCLHTGFLFDTNGIRS